MKRYFRAYREKNLAIIRKKAVARYWRDPVRARAMNRRLMHTEKRRKWFKAWRRRHYKKHRAKVLDYARRWRKSKAYKVWVERNRERIRESFRVWKKAHPRKYRKSVRRHLDRFRSQIYKRSNQARKTPRGRARACAQSGKRRALKRQTEVATESKQIIAFYRKIKVAKRVVCHWCRRVVHKTRRVVDHRIPLAKGGGHVLNNLLPCCVGCNRAKHCKLPSDPAFRAYLKMLKLSARAA